MNIKEKIAFLFSCNLSPQREKIGEPIIKWVLSKGIYSLDSFSIGVTAGFVGLSKNNIYKYKIYIYKNEKNQHLVPHIDTGIIFKPEDKNSDNEIISVTFSENIQIRESPEIGIYEIKAMLYNMDDEKTPIDTASSYFEMSFD